jgi:hypothetical protein
MMRRLVFLAAVLTSSCVRVSTITPAQMRQATVQSWMSILNTSETKFFASTRGQKYANLADIQVPPAPDGFLVDFHLTTAGGYTISLRSSDKLIPSYYSDDTAVVRACAAPGEPGPRCAPIYIYQLVLIAAPGS